MQLIEGIDFSVAPHEQLKASDWLAVTILSETYKGVVVSFGQVSFSPPNAEGYVECKFEREVLEHPATFNKSVLESDLHFNQFLGDIVISILETSLGELEETNDIIEG